MACLWKAKQFSILDFDLLFLVLAHPTYLYSLIDEKFHRLSLFSSLPGDDKFAPVWLLASFLVCLLRSNWYFLSLFL